MPGLRWSGKPRHIHQADMAGALAPAQRYQSFGDESAIETNKRNHIRNRAERDIGEKAEEIRFGPVTAPKAALAEHAIDGNDRHESEPDGSKMTQAGEVIAPVRVDDGARRRQFLVGLMMINHDDIEATRFRLRQRFETRRAAIDTD